MMGLTVAQRQEKIRMAILGALLSHKDLTARQISYELSVEGLWQSADQIAHDGK